jgi:hypothetical protein
MEHVTKLFIVEGGAAFKPAQLADSWRCSPRRQRSGERRLQIQSSPAVHLHMLRRGSGYQLAKTRRSSKVLMSAFGGKVASRGMS